MQGAPETHTADRPQFTFEGHLPELRDLMPNTGGLPGITYAQVHVTNVKRAQDLGYGNIRGAQVYTIKGPNGEADCMLMGTGTVIAGIEPRSGRPICNIDPEVVTLTGLTRTKSNLVVRGMSLDDTPKPGAAAAQKSASGSAKAAPTKPASTTKPPAPKPGNTTLSESELGAS